MHKILFRMPRMLDCFPHGPINCCIVPHRFHEPPDAREKAQGLPGGAAKVIQKAMSKKPSERFGTAGEFVRALEGG